MSKFLVVLILVNYLKKNVDLKGLPDVYHKILNSFLLPLAGITLAASFAGNKFEHLLNLIWFVFFAFLLYTIYLKKDKKQHRQLFVVGLIFVTISTFRDVSQFLAPQWIKQYSDYIDLSYFGGFVGIFVYLLTLKNQQKALEKEEEKNKIISSQKDLLEEQVKARTVEITRQKEELEETIKKLTTTQDLLIQSEKLASLGELTAGIAHEIQNPLNFVNNFSELSAELVQEMEEELKAGQHQNALDIAHDLKENLQKITHHGHRASSIVKGMLEHSRSSTGVKEAVDINALADEYLRLAYHGLRAKDKSFNVKFKTDFDPQIPKVMLVTQDMGRVLLNIINNAFYAVNLRKKSAEPDYEALVELSTSLKNEGMLEIKIRDNGVGIPAESKKKIFQPFFTTKPTGEGTGLGLSLSYDIVKAHGGDIKLSSKPKEFTEFTINIPVS